MSRKSAGEENLWLLVNSDLWEGFPIPEREYRFCERRWRLDFAWPEKRVGLEVEGGVWVGGRHNRGSGFIQDMEKYNAAASMGWVILRVTPDQVTSQETIDMLKGALA